MMDDLAAIMIVEGDTETTRENYIAAWQHLVDTGLVWQLQGWYGRTAMAFIKQGVVKAREAKHGRVV